MPNRDFITALIAIPAEESFVAFAFVVWHADAVAARLFTISLQMMAIVDFTVIATEAFRTSTAIVAVAFASVHTWYYALCWNISNVASELSLWNRKKPLK